MKIYTYKKIDIENLNDHEKVLAFFLTMMFRKIESERMVLTINAKDLANILYGGRTGEMIRSAKLNQESALGKFFSFAVLGNRVAIRIKDEMFNSYKWDRRLGTIRTSIEQESAIRMCIYLHATLQHMREWFTDDDFNIFYDDDQIETRFAPDAAEHFGIHEQFRARNIFQPK